MATTHLRVGPSEWTFLAEIDRSAAKLGRGRLWPEAADFGYNGQQEQNQSRFEDQFQVISKLFSLAILLIVLPASVTFAEEPVDCGSNSSSTDIVGVWRLVEASTTLPDGTVQYPYGNPAAGLFVYTPGGHLSLHLHKNPPRDRFTQRPSDSELGAVARGYIGYYGTWSISGNSVIHHIDGAMSPNRFGQDAERPFTLCGNVLELNIEGSGSRIFYRRLERVESFSE